MRACVVGFAVGVWVLQQQAQLPAAVAFVSLPLLIVALLALVGLAIWAVVAFRNRTLEKPSEASSHYESGIGTNGPPPDATG